MSGMNIQLDNLCQFLPQEKVVEFTKMSSQDLLESTEKAVSNLQVLFLDTNIIKKCWSKEFKT